MTDNQRSRSGNQKRSRRFLAAAAAFFMLIGTIGSGAAVFAAEGPAENYESVLTEAEDAAGPEEVTGGGDRTEAPDGEEVSDPESIPREDTEETAREADAEAREDAEEELLQGEEEAGPAGRRDEEEAFVEEEEGAAAIPSGPAVSGAVPEKKKAGAGKAASISTSDYAGLVRCPTDTEHPADDCVMIGVPGTFISEADAALARINEIRLEACQEGVPDPNTGEPLTMDDYVPVKWSYSLEYIARIRAAEAALTSDHYRTNGYSCFDIAAPNGEYSMEEALAWNRSLSTVAGIEQWYREKSYWTDQTMTSAAVHYKQLIDPSNRCVGLGTFCLDESRPYTTTAGEFSYSCEDESRISFEGDCIQLLEADRYYLSGSGTIEGPSSGGIGEDAFLYFLTDVYYSAATTGNLVLEPVTWTSSDDTIASVSEDGIVHGIRSGTVTITASCPGTSLYAETEFTVAGEENAVIRSASASFEGKIGVNFYLALPDRVLEDAGAYAQLTHGEEILKVPVSEASVRTSGDETLYGFTFHVAAAEIRDTINLRIFDGKGEAVTLKNKAGTNDYTETGVDYALITYASRLLSSSNEEEAALARALIDYGTAAEIFFRGSSEGTISGAVGAVTGSDLDPYKGAFEGAYPEGMTSRSISALFESDNTLRLYYGFGTGIDGSAYTYTIDGKAARAVSGSGGWYLEVANVPAPELDTVHAFTISKGGMTYTVRASVLTYARSSVVNGPEARQDLGKALYLYNLAARAYFD